MIYLDNASTTSVFKEVHELMNEVSSAIYGNPMNKYYLQAIQAKEVIDKARKQAASLLKCSENNVIFTSGASESNNMVLKGLLRPGDHLITTSIEHKSILEPIKYLRNYGIEVTFLPVNENGQINLAMLEESLQENTKLISLMWVNNEIGTTHPVNEIRKICTKNKIMFHSDLTQGVGKLRVPEETFDFASFSAHKIHGPKGVGVLYIGNDEDGIRREITPLIHGGNQEFGLRGGTHSVHNIAGLGLAAEITMKTLDCTYKELKEADEIYIDTLINLNLADTIIGGDFRIPGIINFRVPGIVNELFFKEYSNVIACSSGSACNFGEPSYVIQEVRPQENPSERIRISFENKKGYRELKTIINDYTEKYL